MAGAGLREREEPIWGGRAAPVRGGARGGGVRGGAPGPTSARSLAPVAALIPRQRPSSRFPAAPDLVPAARCSGPVQERPKEAGRGWRGGRRLFPPPPALTLAPPCRGGRRSAGFAVWKVEGDLALLPLECVGGGARIETAR